MNEMLSPLRGRIDLRLEPPFRLGRFRVSPSTLEITGPGGAVALEPRVMQVLVALHRGRGEAVSREELSDLCWDGRIVGEDALNRSVSRLRKALAAEPTVFVDTIPKVGYRLRQGVAPEPASPAAAAAAAPPAKARFPRRAATLAGLLALAVVAVAVALLLRREPAPWSASALRPLTREAGVEMDPALSPQGQWIAWSGSAGFGAPRDIFLRGLSVGEAAPLRITDTPGADEHGPAWSPDGTRLAFVRMQPGRPCAIVVMQPPRGAERVVGACRVQAGTTLAWSGPEELVFADRSPADPSGPIRLFSLHVRTGAARELARPPPESQGDNTAAPSPDGRWIAFRRAAGMGADDIHLLDRRSGRVTALTDGGFKAAGLAWSADSRTVFFTSNQGGDFGLWAVDPSLRAEPRRVTVGLVWLGALSADRGNRLAVEAVRNRSEIIAAPRGGPLRALTRPAGMDWDPDFAADGAMAYGSDVSGSNEIWAQRPGAQPVRLTDFRGSFVYAPRWSPDGREVAFMGVIKGRTDVYVVRADGAGLRRLTADGDRKGAVAWVGDGSTLLYSAKPDARWRLYRVGRDGGGSRLQPGGEDIIVPRRGPDAAIYVRTDADGAIRRFDPASGRAERLGPTVSDVEAWAPARDGVYWIDRQFGRGSVVQFTPWSGPAREVATVAPPPRVGIAVRPSDGAPVFARQVQHDIDVVMLEVRRP